MARQVLPIVGAVIGAYFGGPQGAQIGFAIGSLVGNAVDPLKVAGPKLGEGSGQTSSEGVYRPIVLGTAPVGGNIIHRGPEVVRRQRDQAGKGGGPITITERRYRTFAIRVAEGPIGGILRAWMDEKLVYDIRPGSPIPDESIEFSKRFRLYIGDEDQLPDPALEAYLGVGNVNSYRGTAYVVFENFDLTDYGDRIPQFRFEVTEEIEQLSVHALAMINDDAISSAVPSPNGYDWSAVRYPEGTVPTSAGYLIGGPDRYIGHGIGGSGLPWYTLDHGLTWTQATGSPFTPRGRGSYASGSYMLPTDTGVAESRDGGETWTISGPSGAPSFVCVMVVGESDNLAITTDTGFLYRKLFGGPWQQGDALGLSISSGDGFAAGIGEIRYGGQLGGVPAIRRTTDGLSSFGMVLPEPIDETVIRAMAFGVIGDTEIWLAGTDSGAVYRDIGDGWEMLPWETHGLCLGITFVGTGFALASAGASSFESRIQYTINGDAVEDRPLFGNYLINSIGSLVVPNVSVGSPVSLSRVVGFLHERVGVSESKYSVSELIDSVDGIVFADGYTAADAVRTLMPIYMFDAVECDSGSGYRLNYVKRGKPVVAVLTIDDLVDEPEESVREDALERPRVLHLHFQNPTIGYAPAKASPRRNSPDVKVVGEITTSVPVVFSDVNEAWRRADVLLRVAWTEVSGKQEMTLADNLVTLVPTDCIGLVLRGQVRRLRMIRQEISGGILKTEWMTDRQSSYTSNLTGIPLPDPEPPPPSISGPTVSIFGDWPALSDNHDALVSYAAASGATEAWWGATYQRSLNGGANYGTVATFDSMNSIMGVLVDTVSAASSHYTDTTNQIRVLLYTDDEIESISQQEFLSEGGAFALSWMDGDQRKWEIVQYRDAEQDSSGVWTMTTLQRGRLNTQAASHAEGDVFVLLDNAIKVLPMQSAWLGTELTHRAVSNGQSPELALAYTDEFLGESQREWEVANLFGQLTGETLTVSCVPRHRFGTDDAPVQSVNHDGYRWTASDGSNSAAADTAGTTHDFDVTGWATPITIAVAQLNRITGPGPAVSEEIE